MTPSLDLIIKPTRLLDIAFEKDELLFVNDNNYMTLGYYHPVSKSFHYHRITSRITTRSLLFEIRHAYVTLACSEPFDINKLVIKDIVLSKRNVKVNQCAWKQEVLRQLRRMCVLPERSLLCDTAIQPNQPRGILPTFELHVQLLQRSRC